MTGVLVVMPILGLVLGVVLLVVGFAGLRGSLRRNRFLGLRTAATMRSEEAFRLAHRIAGLPVVIGGSVAVAGALIEFALDSTAAQITVAVVTLLGGVAIAGAGANMGNRAAMALPEPVSTQVGGGCTGCMCGQGGGCGGPA